jgi:hypothetical protein
MLFRLGDQYDGNGQVGVSVLKSIAMGEGLIAQYGKLFPPPLNNMEIPTHFRNGQIEEGKCKLWWLKSDKSPSPKSPYKWKS